MMSSVLKELLSQKNEALSVESMIERINLIPDSFIAARNSEGTVVGYVSGPVTEGRYLDDESFERTEANPKTGGFKNHQFNR